MQKLVRQGVMETKDADPVDRGSPPGRGLPGARWLGLWIATAAAIVVGLLLYLGWTVFPIGKGFVPGPLLDRVALALVAIGVVGILVSAAGIVGSRWLGSIDAAGWQPTMPDTVGVRWPDVSAYVSLIAVSLALATLILIFFAWPTVERNARPGPCDQSPTAACFSAHSQFYQELPPGSGHITTPMTRFSDAVFPPAYLGAWLLALAGALTGVLALASGAGRSRVAVLGLTLGSITLAGMAAQYFAFAIFGGGE
jgi:hypothetical protein